jgi:hypothetical protein
MFSEEPKYIYFTLIYDKISITSSDYAYRIVFS